MQSLPLATETRSPIKRDKLLRLPDVEALTGCKKSTLYGFMRAERFPAVLRISALGTAARLASSGLQWVCHRGAADRSAR